MIRKWLIVEVHRIKHGLMVCITTLAFNQGISQVFPGLEGEELVQALREEFTPTQLLNDTQVKDTLYSRIFIVQDTVKCIYSGFPRFLPPGEDPSQWLYGTGLEAGSVNLEHAWPQAKGADEGTQGNMDMHHLYPSRTKINSDRADFPYADIQDQLTQLWYYLDQQLSMIPTNNVNAYSEFKTGSFEPRESVKGDIARAMLYFWTIYREDAMEADPFYFDVMKDFLCQWHSDDPVDNFEELRNERIAGYQGGKMNPFILDCTLARRAYCFESSECETVNTTDELSKTDYILFVSNEKKLILFSQEDGDWEMKISDILGHVLLQHSIQAQQPLHLNDLPTGVYFAWASTKNKKLVQKFFIP